MKEERAAYEEFASVYDMFMEEIPYKKFFNRSDMAGGSTLGSIASSMVPVPTVDVGVPLLAMHSARELMGVEDERALTDLLRAYYTL